MNPMTLWATLTPTIAPIAMASAELISRLRRSTRWSKNDILPPVSCSSSVVEGSDCGVVIRGFLVGSLHGFRQRMLRTGLGWRPRCSFASVAPDVIAQSRIIHAAALRVPAGFGGSGGTLTALAAAALLFADAGLAVQFAHLVFERVSKIVGHFAEFSRRLSSMRASSGSFCGPKITSAMTKRTTR